MKWLRTLVLFDKGDVITSDDWKSLHESYVRSIQSIDNPRGSGSLKLRKKVKLPNNQWLRNGVGYLRTRFLDHIQNAEGWKAEGVVDLKRDRKQPAIKLYPSLDDYREPITSDFGGFDLVDSGILKWPTSAVCSGPPVGQNELLVWTERELRTGGGSWTGEPVSAEAPRTKFRDERVV